METKPGAFITLKSAAKRFDRSTSAIWRGVKAHKIRVLDFSGTKLLVSKDVTEWARNPLKAKQRKLWSMIENERIVKSLRAQMKKEKKADESNH